MINGQLNIRRATKDDIDKILEIEKESFSSPWSRETFMEEFCNNLLAYYSVIELGGEIIGYTGMWIIIDEAHITNVAVHPKARGLNIGELAMRHLMGIAKLHGAERMTLEVRTSNKIAIKLYNKLNFIEHGIRKNYYINPTEDAKIMWVEL
ncbi:MAG: ribosomal protein S18-alanine N-acetyltransferase [Vulcanibacillus sp.]